MQMPFTVQSAIYALYFGFKSRCGSDTIKLEASKGLLRTLEWKVKGYIYIDGSPELMSIHATIRGAECHLYPTRPFCDSTHLNMVQYPPLEGGLESWAAEQISRETWACPRPKLPSGMPSRAASFRQQQSFDTLRLCNVRNSRELRDP